MWVRLARLDPGQDHCTISRCFQILCESQCVPWKSFPALLEASRSTHVWSSYLGPPHWKGLSRSCEIMMFGNIQQTVVLSLPFLSMTLNCPWGFEGLDLSWKQTSLGKSKLCIRTMNGASWCKLPPECLPRFGHKRVRISLVTALTIEPE